MCFLILKNAHWYKETQLSRASQHTKTCTSLAVSLYYKMHTRLGTRKHTQVQGNTTKQSILAHNNMYQLDVFPCTRKCTPAQGNTTKQSIQHTKTCISLGVFPYTTRKHTKCKETQLSRASQHTKTCTSLDVFPYTKQSTLAQGNTTKQSILTHKNLHQFRCVSLYYKMHTRLSTRKHT